MCHRRIQDLNAYTMEPGLSPPPPPPPKKSVKYSIKKGKFFSTLAGYGFTYDG